MFSLLGFRRRRLENGNGKRKGQNMSDTTARVIMILLGFALAMLGIIYAIHTQDVYLGILVSVGGVASMYVGLPQ